MPDSHSIHEAIFVQYVWCRYCAVSQASPESCVVHLGLSDGWRERQGMLARLVDSRSSETLIHNHDVDCSALHGMWAMPMLYSVPSPLSSCLGSRSRREGMARVTPTCSTLSVESVEETRVGEACSWSCAVLAKNGYNVWATGQLLHCSNSENWTRHNLVPQHFLLHASQRIDVPQHRHVARLITHAIPTDKARCGA